VFLSFPNSVYSLEPRSGTIDRICGPSRSRSGGFNTVNHTLVLLVSHPWRGRLGRGVDDDGGDWWSFPSLQHVPSRSVRVWSRGLKWRRRTSSSELMAPTPSYMCCATGAHQPSNGLGVPDPDASQGPNGPLGPLVERSIQHCALRIDGERAPHHNSGGGRQHHPRTNATARTPRDEL
jgi:hypothetical protein